jgi:hypothetical protein
MTFQRELSLPVLGGSSGSFPVIIPRQTLYKQKRPCKNQWIFHEIRQFFEGFGIPGIAGSLILIFLKYPKLTVLWFLFFLKYLKLVILWKIIELHNIGFYFWFGGCKRHLQSSYQNWFCGFLKPLISIIFTKNLKQVQFKTKFNSSPLCTIKHY